MQGRIIQGCIIRPCIIISAGSGTPRGRSSAAASAIQDAPPVVATCPNAPKADTRLVPFQNYAGLRSQSGNPYPYRLFSNFNKPSTCGFISAIFTVVRHHQYRPVIRHTSENSRSGTVLFGYSLSMSTLWCIGDRLVCNKLVQINLSPMHK